MVHEAGWWDGEECERDREREGELARESPLVSILVLLIEEEQDGLEESNQGIEDYIAR